MSDYTPTQRCRTCGNEYPLTFDHFYRDKKSRSGFRSECKQCTQAQQQEYNRENWDRIYAQKKAYVQEHQEEVRAIKRRYYDAHRQRVIDRACEWRNANLDHYREMERKRRAANREKYLAKKREYYSRNRERERARIRRWAKDNEQYRLYKREYKKRWRTPDKVRQENHRRISRLKGAPGEHKAKDIQRIYELQQGRCLYCGIEVGRDYHLDHFIPLNHGGWNSPDNLVIACSSCNCSKQGKMPHEWHGWGGIFPVEWNLLDVHFDGTTEGGKGQ